MLSKFTVKRPLLTSKVPLFRRLVAVSVSPPLMINSALTKLVALLIWPQPWAS
jgi:hypothetical protein